MARLRRLLVGILIFALGALVASFPIAKPVEAQPQRPPTTVEIAGTANVVVANAATNPAVVSDAENPARNPFQLVLCGKISFGSGANLCAGLNDEFLVPTDRRLVIE